MVRYLFYTIGDLTYQSPVVLRIGTRNYRAQRSDATHWTLSHHSLLVGLRLQSLDDYKFGYGYNGYHIPYDYYAKNISIELLISHQRLKLGYCLCHDYRL